MQQICISWCRDIRWGGTMCTRTSNGNRKESSQNTRISGFKCVNAKLLCKLLKIYNLNSSKIIGVQMRNYMDCLLYIDTANSLSVTCCAAAWRRVALWGRRSRPSWGQARHPQHCRLCHGHPATSRGPDCICLVLQKFGVKIIWLRSSAQRSCFNQVVFSRVILRMGLYVGWVLWLVCLLT